MVLARAIVRDTTDSIEKAGSKIAYVTMGMALVPMVGPAIGGLLDYQYGWTASFWVLFLLGGGIHYHRVLTRKTYKRIRLSIRMLHSILRRLQCLHSGAGGERGRGRS